ncbi:DEAD-box helicase Dbp80, partial [Drosophila elegans]|uniref:DEAD-box helicase Dbp80 n=1 Tax=Drosophila elegans TaxID=30023 RepID=UPI001BC849F0
RRYHSESSPILGPLAPSNINIASSATLGHSAASVSLSKQYHIRPSHSAECQMLFFSATYDKEVMDFARLIVVDPTIIRLLREEESLDNIKQFYVKCKNEEGKYNAIQNIYGCISIGQAIIFCHTRRTAAWLAAKMTSDGHSVAVLSGDLTVEQRLAVLDRFRSGLEKVLITTNVLSRGIDIEQVTIVVNFDLPVDVRGNADCETYLHRIGRTGRFGMYFNSATIGKRLSAKGGTEPSMWPIRNVLKFICAQTIEFFFKWFFTMNSFDTNSQRFDPITT